LSSARSDSKSLEKEETFVLTNEARDWGFQLVNRGTLTWFGHRS
jgi:hypothetical protein